MGSDGAAVQRDEGLGGRGRVGSRGSLMPPPSPLLSTRPGAGWGRQPPSCRLDTKPGVGFPRSQPLPPGPDCPAAEPLEPLSSSPCCCLFPWGPVPWALVHIPLPAVRAQAGAALGAAKGVWRVREQGRSQEEGPRRLGGGQPPRDPHLPASAGTPLAAASPLGCSAAGCWPCSSAGRPWLLMLPRPW